MYHAWIAFRVKIKIGHNAHLPKLFSNHLRLLFAFSLFILFFDFKKILHFVEFMGCFFLRNFKVQQSKQRSLEISLNEWYSNIRQEIYITYQMHEMKRV